LTSDSGRPVADLAGLTTDEIVKATERAWPAWQCWAVTHAVGRRITWCARRWTWKPGDIVLNADTPAHLAEYIAEAEHRD
jgi:hypothetical protein